MQIKYLDIIYIKSKICKQVYKQKQYVDQLKKTKKHWQLLYVSNHFSHFSCKIFHSFRFVKKGFAAYYC